MGAAMVAHVLIPTSGTAEGAPPDPLPTSSPTTPSTPSTPSAPSTLSGPALAATGTTTPEQAVRLALDGLGVHHGRYALAVEDLTSGRSAAYGSSAETFTSASIVKVDILAALLLQTQDRGDRLSSAQRQLASDMIRVSDNDAAQKLWIEIGRRQGLDAANARLGLSPAHAGQRGAWGLTRTTARDQIALLKAVFTQDSPLNAASRSYLRGLMGSVTDGQNWGVGAAGAPGGLPVLKNGWLPDGTTRLWVVNSVGIVERAGHSLLVVVLTDAQPTREAGIALVERVATTAVEALVRTP
ncbi:serine hydrolase [Kitasatospora purpeofusca]|uniref:serine hydrolase n=1 Tax=Kitasatospora purpeofusca TaxID=67352 RepID=UPI002A5AB932|nr:serine hydrolase [Kitasatospora purpeofusca]MDY0816383.1 serine hydrolase [Kitasatospora purpeofusca]